MLKRGNIILLFIFFCLSVNGQNLKGQDWHFLFNRKDLSGWDTWLSNVKNEWSPPGTIKEGALGVNNDPYEVFTVVEEGGKAAIRISGKVFGALTSQQEYQNYHLKLQFKWGNAKWAPRDKAKRDSGLLYHCIGSHGTGGGFWMQSQELQIQEGDCGDFWAVAGAGMVVKASKLPNGQFIFDLNGEQKKFQEGESTRRCIKSEDAEKPHGEWNTIELIVFEDRSLHIVNGKVVLVLTNSSYIKNGEIKPLTKGKIQIQSEGAELFYRDIMIKSLEEMPFKYKKYFK